MRSKFLQMIWSDLAPVVALVLALLLTVWTRHSASAEYLDMQANLYYQNQLWSADHGRQVSSLTSPNP